MCIRFCNREVETNENVKIDNLFADNRIFKQDTVFGSCYKTLELVATLGAAILNFAKLTILPFSIGMYATRSTVLARSEKGTMLKNTIICKKCFFFF